MSSTLSNAASQLFLFHNVIELLGALFNLFHELSVFANGSEIVVLVPLFFELTVLVFEVFNFFLKGTDHEIFFIEFLFKEDIINFVSLLDNNQVIVSMSQLAYIVLKLHEFLLQIFLMFTHRLFYLFAFLFLLLVLFE